LAGSAWAERKWDLHPSGAPIAIRTFTFYLYVSLMELSSQGRDWVLTSEALDRLLEQLDSDRDRAAEKYEQIRQRLIKLFRWRGCLDF
jgi:hypothetical protein